MQNQKHRSGRQKRTFGQKAADAIAAAGGSWAFIFVFFIVIFVWMGLNTTYLLFGEFDPYPFILLNLMLSLLAAIQAPIILMSQNRAAERDRVQMERDHYINRKAEREIKSMQIDILEMKGMLSKNPETKEIKKLTTEVKSLKHELEKYENK